MTTDLKQAVSELVAGIEPIDELGRQQCREALAWLGGTDDIFRRSKLRTPSPHLVSYFLLADRSLRVCCCVITDLPACTCPQAGIASRWSIRAIRSGGRPPRNSASPPAFDPVAGDSPFFLTVTETTGPASQRHVDTTLWFALAGQVGQPLQPDVGEFAAVRWWTVGELRQADPGRFEPHLLRALTALGMNP